MSKRRIKTTKPKLTADIDPETHARACNYYDDLTIMLGIAYHANDPGATDEERSASAILLAKQMRVMIICDGEGLPNEDATESLRQMTTELADRNTSDERKAQLAKSIQEFFGIWDGRRRTAARSAVAFS